jgi:CRP-like cAMP-binding protein
VAGEISARVVLPNGSTTDIRSFRGGDLIGEQALFGHQPWPAVYVAASKTMALVLDRGGLEKALLGEADPKGLLDALRADRSDEEVYAAISKMTALRQGE